MKIKKILLSSLVALSLIMTACNGTSSVKPVPSSSPENSSLEPTSSVIPASSNNSETISSKPISSNQPTPSSNKPSSEQPVPSSNQPSSNVNSSSQEPSSSTHQHTYGAMYYAVPATFFNDGNIAYYECSECHKLFDENYQEVSSVIIPKLSTDIVLMVNGTNKGEFTLTTQEKNALVWDIKGQNLKKDDVIGLAAKADNTVSYTYLPDLTSNITDEYKVHNDADNADIHIVGTLNGLHLSISGFEYDGIVIKINDTEYPMHQVSYYENDKQTYIYGYAYINENDVVTVIDKDNDLVYGYDDFENDTKWNTFDFHRGTNGEVVFNYQARYGFEFDRGGDKKLSITKTFVPNNTNATAISFDTDRAEVAMSDTIIPTTDPSYEETLWYISHEAVINADDIKEYIQNNGLHMLSATLELAENENFNLKDLTNNSLIKAEHLVSLYTATPDGYFAINGEYIKTLHAGNYTVVYVPSCSSIAIYENTAATSADAYLMVNGAFKPLTKDANNVVTYENLTVSKNDYVVFTDGSYGFITITFAASVDPTICHKMDTSGMSMIYFDKAGTFTLHLNLDSKELSIDVIDVEEPAAAMTGGYMYFNKYGNKSLTVNPDNADELCLKNMVIDDITGYAAIYDQDFNSISPTLASGSEQYANIASGVLIYITQTGTFDFFINKTTHVLRIEKQA